MAFRRSTVRPRSAPPIKSSTCEVCGLSLAPHCAQFCALSAETLAHVREKVHNCALLGDFALVRCQIAAAFGSLQSPCSALSNRVIYFRSPGAMRLSPQTFAGFSTCSNVEIAARFAAARMWLYRASIERET